MLEMTEHEKFLFDLQGFLHVKNVLTSQEVKALNDAIDANITPSEDYDWSGPNEYGGGMSGEYSVRSESGMITWPKPWCQPFRDLIAHPKIIPYLNTMFGRGWRHEHSPSVIMSRKGTGGHGLHGQTSRHFDGSQCYVYTNGQFRAGLSIFQFQLRDINPGDGGIAVIPGSHKANFKCPEDIMLYNVDQEAVRNVTGKAGDLVIFMETTIHGSLPWNAEYDRRSLMYHYSPRNSNFQSEYYEVKMQDWVSELTDVQRAALEPPYNYNRPLLEDDGKTLVNPGQEPKPHIPRKIHEMD